MSYNTRVKLKSDTEANWLSQDPVLLDGEIAIVRLDGGETRKKIGDGTKKFSELSYDDGDFVQYTAQTLTSDQKKQARENIGAEEMYNGLSKTELFFQLKKSYSKRQFAVYVESGNIIQFEETETDDSDVRLAFRNLAMVMGAVGGITYNNSEISKQVKEFYAAYSAGLITAPFICYGNPYNKQNYYVNINANVSSKLFYVKTIYENGSGYSYQYNYETGTMKYGTFTSAYVRAFSTDALTATPAASQFEMRAAPTADMQIATKKYVDDATSGITVPSKASDLTNDAFVQYTEQTLTDEQKAQARANIGAISGDFIVTITATEKDGTTTYSADKTNAEIYEAYQRGLSIGCRIEGSTVNAELYAIEATRVQFIGHMYNDAYGVSAGYATLTIENDSVSAGGNENILFTPPTSTPSGAVWSYNDGNTGWSALSKDIFLCTVTGSGTDSDPYKCDKTYDEVMAAVDNGQLPICMYSQSAYYGDHKQFLKYNCQISTPSSYYILFNNISMGDSANDFVNISWSFMYLYNSGTVNFHRNNYATAASKQYIDSKLTDKELILSSSTEGSTKKFKLTIDDTGTLTASEITA